MNAEFPFHCDATVEWKGSQKVRNPGYPKELRHMREFKSQAGTDC